MTAASSDQTQALRLLLHQTEISGTHRRALLLHMDRLPPAVAKPHHQRLARAALLDLTLADRAQSFELPRGRLAIVWRHQGGRELDGAMAALNHLMADLPPEQALPPGQLVSLYDLPAQAAWLLDELTDRRRAAANSAPSIPIDGAALAQLEHLLAQADIVPFMRWRPVLRVTSAGSRPEWDERYIAPLAVAASLCPGRNFKSSPWLFRRLTRSFDRRILALLTGPQELRGCVPFAIHLHVCSMLSPDFLKFDAALPGGLRGLVTLYVEAADILADPAAFAFARNFVHARGYRLLLRGASPALLALMDIGAAEIDFIQVPFCPEVETDPDSLRVMVPPSTQVVICENDVGAARPWATRHGINLLRSRSQYQTIP